MPRYKHPDYPGVAWAETYPNTQDEETGLVRYHMVGDDRDFAFDPDDLIELNEDEYCHECGQIGCKADGRGDDD